MTTHMKLKVLESHLQTLDEFSDRKVYLEQYITPPHIAAVILSTMQNEFEAIEDKLILDAGCGPGSLGIGASLLGAGSITAMDVDRDALKIFHKNVSEMEIPNIDAVNCDFLDPTVYRWENFYDTVIMNPPFGTKHNKGIDLQFLEMGYKLSCENVFSLHKSSTRSHIKNVIKKWGAKGWVVAELRFDIQKTYKFHKEQSRDVAVDLWRVCHPHS